MIASQRKAHRFIWVGITVMFPVLLFFATNDLDILSSESSKPMAVLPSKETDKWIENQNVKAVLSDGQLQIQLIESFKSPSVLLYEWNSSGSRGELIGQLMGRGNYRFPVAPDIKEIVVVDEIKETELLKLQF